MQVQDIEYLKTSGISKTLSRALAETYVAKPEHPVDFLAHWLLRHVDVEKQKEIQEAKKAEMQRKCEEVLLEEHRRQIEAQAEQLRGQIRSKEKLALIGELEKVS